MRRVWSKVVGGFPLGTFVGGGFHVRRWLTTSSSGVVSSSSSSSSSGCVRHPSTFPSDSHYSCVVVGVGGIGSGTLYWLTKKLGAGKVLGIEQFQLGHDRGSSQDHSRVIRLSYHSPNYVTLASKAYEAWEEVEAELGHQLIIKTTGVDLFPSNGAIPISDYTSSLQTCRIPFSLFTADEIMRRWPMFKLDKTVVGIFQEDAGIAPAALCNEAHVKLALKQGATILENSKVQKIHTGDKIKLELEGGKVVSCEKLLITAGAWSNNLLNLMDFNIPMTITREQVVYLSPRGVPLTNFAIDNFPIFIWMDDPSFYGFPVFGEQAIKVAQDCGGYETTADTRNFEVDDANLARVRAFLSKHIPSANGDVVKIKTCLYELTPDRDFVLDRLPGNENVFVCIGAGHGFKFASVLGKLLSELAVEGKTVSHKDISAWSVERPILKMEKPPRSWIV